MPKQMSEAEAKAAIAAVIKEVGRAPAPRTWAR